MTEISPAPDLYPQRCVLPRGRIVKRALAAEPEHSYFVYVPDAHVAGAPMLVCVHGLSRNAHEIMRTFMPLCASHGVALLAPVFGGEHYGDYQRLGRTGRGRRADRFLNHCVQEAAALAGADPQRFYLFGFSGGAQFAHRYLMAEPQRVIAAVIATAGWYTFPDSRHRYPYGIGRSRKLPGVRFNPEEFLHVPVTVLVGTRDVGSAHLRNTPRLDAQQGVTRLERARRWTQAMHACAGQYGVAARTQLVEVPSVDHSFVQFCRDGSLPDRVFQALFQSALTVSATPAPANHEAGVRVGTIA